MIEEPKSKTTVVKFGYKEDAFILYEGKEKASNLGILEAKNQSLK